MFINLWASMNTFVFYEKGEIKIICTWCEIMLGVEI
jgi:hypothetical protein